MTVATREPLDPESSTATDGSSSSARDVSAQRAGDQRRNVGENDWKSKVRAGARILTLLRKVMSWFWTTGLKYPSVRGSSFVGINLRELWGSGLRSAVNLREVEPEADSAQTFGARSMVGGRVYGTAWPDVAHTVDEWTQPVGPRGVDHRATEVRSVPKWEIVMEPSRFEHEKRTLELLGIATVQYYPLYEIIRTMDVPQGIERENRLRLDALHRAFTGPFTAAEAAGALDLPRDRTRRLLAYLTKRGWLTRVKQGLYGTVPLGTKDPGAWLADPWVAASVESSRATSVDGVRRITGD